MLRSAVGTQCGSYMAAEAHYLKKAPAVFFHLSSEAQCVSHRLPMVDCYTGPVLDYTKKSQLCTKEVYLSMSYCSKGLQLFGSKRNHTSHQKL